MFHSKQQETTKKREITVIRNLVRKGIPTPLSYAISETQDVGLTHTQWEENSQSIASRLYKSLGILSEINLVKEYQCRILKFQIIDC